MPTDKQKSESKTLSSASGTGAFSKSTDVSFLKQETKEGAKGPHRRGKGMNGKEFGVLVKNSNIDIAQYKAISSISCIEEKDKSSTFTEIYKAIQAVRTETSRKRMLTEQELRELKALEDAISILIHNNGPKKKSLAYFHNIKASKIAKEPDTTPEERQKKFTEIQQFKKSYAQKIGNLKTALEIFGIGKLNLSDGPYAHCKPFFDWYKQDSAILSDDVLIRFSRFIYGRFPKIKDQISDEIRNKDLIYLKRKPKPENKKDQISDKIRNEDLTHLKIKPKNKKDKAPKIQLAELKAGALDAPDAEEQDPNSTTIHYTRPNPKSVLVRRNIAKDNVENVRRKLSQIKEDLEKLKEDALNKHEEVAPLPDLSPTISQAEIQRQQTIFFIETLIEAGLTKEEIADALKNTSSLSEDEINDFLALYFPPESEIEPLSTKISSDAPVDPRYYDLMVSEISSDLRIGEESIAEPKHIDLGIKPEPSSEVIPTSPIDLIMVEKGNNQELSDRLHIGKAGKITPIQISNIGMIQLVTVPIVIANIEERASQVQASTSQETPIQQVSQVQASTSQETAIEQASTVEKLVQEPEDKQANLGVLEPVTFIELITPQPAGTLVLQQKKDSQSGSKEEFLTHNFDAHARQESQFKVDIWKKLLTPEGILHNLFTAEIFQLAFSDIYNPKVTLNRDTELDIFVSKVSKDVVGDNARPEILDLVEQDGREKLKQAIEPGRKNNHRDILIKKSKTWKELDKPEIYVGAGFAYEEEIVNGNFQIKITEIFNPDLLLQLGDIIKKIDGNKLDRFGKIKELSRVEVGKDNLNAIYEIERGTPPILMNFDIRRKIIVNPQLMAPIEVKESKSEGKETKAIGTTDNMHSLTLSSLSQQPPRKISKKENLTKNSFESFVETCLYAIPARSKNSEIILEEATYGLGRLAIINEFRAGLQKETDATASTISQSSSIDKLSTRKPEDNPRGESFLTYGLKIFDSLGDSQQEKEVGARTKISEKQKTREVTTPPQIWRSIITSDERQGVGSGILGTKNR